MKRIKFDLFQFSAYCIVIGVTFGSAINFGFVFGSWFYPVLGEGSFADLAVSWATGLLLGLGAFGLFLKSEKALKTILRLAGWERIIRAADLALLNLLFVGVGIAGLLFRASFLSSRGVGYLVFIGIAVEFFPFLIGVILYPIQNPDVKQLQQDLGDKFDRAVIEEAYEALGKQSLGKRYQAYTGDFAGALEGAVRELKEPEKQEPRRLLKRGSTQVTMEDPKEQPQTQPLPSQTGEVDQEELKALITQMMQKLDGASSAPFLQALQTKNRA